MTTRTHRSVPVLVVALLVLGVGVFATASAGNAAAALTKSQVKKIATKVVKKQAKKITVANAINLAGKPASTYLEQATVYNVPITSGATSHLVTLPLGPGRYQISYSVFMVGGSEYSYCQVRRDRGGDFLRVADDTSDSDGAFPSVSGIGYLDIIAGDVVTLYCSSNGAWTTAADEPAQIVVNPLDSVTSSGLTASRGKVPAGRS